MALLTTLTAVLPAFLAQLEGHGPITNDDAGVISLVGLATVFSGLVVLCLFMMALAELLNEKGGHEPDPVAATGPTLVGAEAPMVEAVEPDAEVAASQPEQTPAEPEWEPEVNPGLVPMTLLTSAVMAYHMYERGELALGKKAAFHLDGKDRAVTLLSAGFCNRALVDGEEVVFNLSEVAPNDAVGRKIVPAG